MTPPIPHAILDAYGLGDSQVTPLAPDDRAWVVEHVSGRFIVQQRSEGPPASVLLDSLQASCALMSHLHARGFPCPGVLRRRDGAFLTVSVQGAFQVLTFLEGGPPEGPVTSGMAGQVGLWLGHMHRLQEGLDLCRTARPDLPRRIREGLDQRVREWDLWGIDRPDLRLAAQQAKQGLEDSWQSLLRLPSGLMHTDASPGNLHFTEGRLVGFIDFEVIPGPFLLDLGMTFVLWAFRFDIASQKSCLDRDLARSLLKAYAGGRHMEPDESSAAGEAILLASSWWWARQRPHRPGDPAYRLTSRGEVHGICRGLDREWLRSLTSQNLKGSRGNR